MPEPAAVLSVRSLTVTAGSQTILRDVVLDVPSGQVTAVIGPSGAGKSTLLRCLNRLVDLTPSLGTTGSVLFRGQDVRARGTDVDELRRRIGIVFQQPVTFPGLDRAERPLRCAQARPRDAPRRRGGAGDRPPSPAASGTR